MAKQGSTSNGKSAKTESLPIIYRITLANEVSIFRIDYTEPEITVTERVFYQNYKTHPDFVPPGKVVLTFKRRLTKVLHAFGFSVGDFCVSQELHNVIDANFPGEVDFRPITVESNEPMTAGPYFLIRVPKNIEPISSREVYPSYRARDVAGVDIWRSGGGIIHCSERFRKTLVNSGVSTGWKFDRRSVV